MISRTVKIIVGLAATALLIFFIVGLAISISTGFAGFWGGLPFWVIIIFVLSLAAYDFWDECVRKK
jgi:sterol desaturase/sphingolipid hydroxylase (fatty acid hydroxylase superfamily)